MINTDDKIDDEVDDILTNDEQQILESIQKVSFVKPKEEINTKKTIKNICMFFLQNIIIYF